MNPHRKPTWALILTDFKRGNFAMPEYCCDADLQMLVDIANTKIEKMLGPKVYGNASLDGWGTHQDHSDTHEGYIFAARPIAVSKPQCEVSGEHETKHWTMEHRDSDGWVERTGQTTCKHCNRELTAKWIVRE